MLEVVKGGLAAPFWGGVVILGLALPLALELVYLTSYTDAGQGTQIALGLIATIPGVIGGFFLRFVVVAGAIKVPLMVMGRPAPGRGGVRFRVEI